MAALIVSFVIVVLLRKRLTDARIAAAHNVPSVHNVPPSPTQAPPPPATIGPIIKPESPPAPAQTIAPTPPPAQAPTPAQVLPPAAVVLKEIDPLKPDGQPKDMFEMAEERFEQEKRVKELLEGNDPKDKSR
jgi:hypothetical protein